MTDEYLQKLFENVNLGSKELIDPFLKMDVLRVIKELQYTKSRLAEMQEQWGNAREAVKDAMGLAWPCGCCE